MLKVAMCVSLALSSVFFYGSGFAGTTSSTQENMLSEYTKIVEDFNAQYHTNYQIATPEQLEQVGADIDVEYASILAMTHDEFWEYLYEAHRNNVAMYDSSSYTIENMPYYAEEWKTEKQTECSIGREVKSSFVLLGNESSGEA